MFLIHRIGKLLAGLELHGLLDRAGDGLAGFRITSITGSSLGKRKCSQIERAFFVMVQLPYLQPFEDVNKRVSRLGAKFHLFATTSACPLSFIDVPEQAYVEGTLGADEFNQVDLLRDLFVWAYERSCQRYLAITQTMVEPDPLRIRYREALIKAVQTIVRDGMIPTAQNIRDLTDEPVLENDRQAFSKLVLEAIEHLHCIAKS